MERGVDVDGKKHGGRKGIRGGGRGGGKKAKGASRRPRAKEDRGRGPPVLCWRMFNVELPVDVDPGKDDCGVSEEVRDVFSFLCEGGVWGMVVRKGAVAQICFFLF